MTGTDSAFLHTNQSRSYLNHFVSHIFRHDFLSLTKTASIIYVFYNFRNYKHDLIVTKQEQK